LTPDPVDPPEPGDVTGRFVDHALGLHWVDVGAGARRAALSFLHDSLCVGVSGAAAPLAAPVLAVARAFGDGGRARVLGRPGVRLPKGSAAFVNAFQIHCQEFDCVHEPAVLHPMATVLACLLAEAETGPAVRGEDFLAAMVAGVDVAVALGLAATTPLRFFRPATAGVFGATAALARLRGLDRAAAQDAFGYALAFAAGTMQAHLEGKPALPVQVANAARGALTAVDLAAAGLKGPKAAIEGPYGYLTLFEAGHDLAPVLEALAKIRRIEEVSWKPFPTGRAAHGGLVAMKTLIGRHGVSAAGLRTLTFIAPPLIRRLVGRPAMPGMDLAYGRLSLPWLAALLLLKGDVGLKEVAPDHLADPAVLELAARITVLDDGGADPAAFTPVRAVAQMRSGAVFETRVETMLGAPAAPLSPEAQAAKARICLEAAGLGDRQEALAAAVAGLEAATDAGEMLCAWAPEARMS
jgi:2-methylcitrate dehydratase PrpD